MAVSERLMGGLFRGGEPVRRAFGLLGRAVGCVVVGFGLVGLLTAGCTAGGSSEDSVAMIESSDNSTGSVTESIEEPVPQPVVAEFSEGDVAAATAAYQQFLAVRDDAYFDPEGDLSALRALASEPVVSEVEKFWGRNRVFTDNGAGILSRTSRANVVEASVSGEQVKILDCVEVLEGNEDESFSPVRFVEHEATMVAVDDGWFVDVVRVIRSGDLADTDWLGCVPGYHEERVTATVEDFAARVTDWKADREPSDGADISEFFDGRLRAESVEALAQQREQFGDRFMSGVEERYVKVAGSDIATGGWNFLVELCLYYPSGEIWTDVASGAEVVQKPPGSATRVGYRVRSDEAADGSWSDAIVDLTPVEYPSPCFDEL